MKSVSPPPENDYNPPISMPDYLIRHATLRQLQVFEAIVRHGNFTRASEELFLTQPTVADSLHAGEKTGRCHGPTLV